MPKLKLLDNVLHNHQELLRGSVIDTDEHGMDVQVTKSLIENAAALWQLFVRVNPETGISERQRCAMTFNSEWQTVEVDDATRKALEQDSCLELSDNEPNNPESDTQQDSADAAQGSEETGTASAVGGEEQPTDRGPEPDAAEALATGDTDSTGENAPVANEANTDASDEIQAGGDAPAADAAGTMADGTADKDVEQQANGQQIDEAEQRRKDIALAIGMLGQANPEHWLKDGRPNVSAIGTVSGLTVTAEERDSVWASLNKGAE